MNCTLLLIIVCDSSNFKGQVCTTVCREHQAFLLSHFLGILKHMSTFCHSHTSQICICLSTLTTCTSQLRSNKDFVCLSFIGSAWEQFEATFWSFVVWKPFELKLPSGCQALGWFDHWLIQSLLGSGETNACDLNDVPDVIQFRPHSGKQIYHKKSFIFK